jgi:hypothetical protein
MCGGACATKYLCLGLVAAPVLVVMFLIAAAARSWRRVGQWALAAALCVLPLSPWLIRNGVNTGNPVFPLATNLLGRGHWLPEQTARWNAGHAPPTWDDKLVHLAAAAADSHGFGLTLPLTAALAAAWMSIRRRTETLDRLCLGILVLQVGVWALTTHMPTRFLIPAAVPMAILAGGLLSKAAPRDSAAAPGGKKLLLPALALAIIVPNFIQAAQDYWLEGRALEMAAPAFHGQTTEAIANLGIKSPLYQSLRAGDRLLMVGDVRPFGFPAGTLYASVWEMDPLVRLARQGLDARQILTHLRRDYGVTHLWIHWGEIHRVRQTYGWWSEVTPGLVDRLVAAGARPIDLDVPGAALPRLEEGRPLIQLLEIRDVAFVDE